jgi:putative effector of murein hydrolase
MKFMKSNSKYIFRIAVALTGYSLGLLAFAYSYSTHLPHRNWLVLLLVLPLIYMATAILRRVSEMDEMWRKIVSEALAFSAIATGFTCISYMFLRDMGAPEFRAQWAFCIMWAYYGIGLFFSWRRYK